jgi:hypothetical protein
MLHEIVLRYPDREEVISSSGSPGVEQGGMLTVRGHTWLVEHVEDRAEPPTRRYICVRKWDAHPPPT